MLKYELIATREDVPSLMAQVDGRGIMLHSSFYPSREGESQKEKFRPGKYDFLIVLGTGLGYHLMPLQGLLGDYHKVILVDILAGIEREIAGNRLTSFLTESEKVKFITGKAAEEVEEFISSELDFNEISGLAILEHPVSMRVFENYYLPIRDRVNRMINRKAGSRAARKAFGGLYLRNIIKNMWYLGNCLPVKDIFGKLKGYPGLIIASGPSLEESLDLIRANQERFFIAASDSAAPVLLRCGISPDFFVSVDPQPHTYEHLCGLDLSRVHSVLSLSSAPEIVRRMGGFISLNTHPVSQLISGVFPGAIGSIDSGTGSVAGDAVSLGCLLGLAPLGLLGFDFSFLHYRIYSRGTAYQERYAKFFSNRMNPVENQNLDYMMRSSRGFRHAGRFTRKAFLQYKESTEDFIFKGGWGGITKISQGGLLMEGINDAGAKEFFGTNSFLPVLDKRGILERILKGVSTIDETMDIPRLVRYLKERKIIDEIIDNSADDISEAKKRRIGGLIHSLL